MKMKPRVSSAVKFLCIIFLYPLVSFAQEPAPDDRIKKIYLRDEISEMVVAMRSGGLFIKAGSEKYFWRPYENELPDRLDVIFHFLAHIDRARSVEIVRLPPNEEKHGNGPREREGESYLTIDEVNIVFNGALR